MDSFSFEISPEFQDADRAAHREVTEFQTVPEVMCTVLRPAGFAALFERVESLDQAQQLCDAGSALQTIHLWTKSELKVTTCQTAPCMFSFVQSHI